MHVGNVQHGLASCQLKYYGKRKPASPDGDDAGLQEIYSCWRFPVSEAKTIHVLPKWRNQVKFWEENWDPRNLDTTYPKVLESHGITEKAYLEILTPMNKILQGYFPFQSKSQLVDKDPSGGAHGSFYLAQLRKRLRQVRLKKLQLNDAPNANACITDHQCLSTNTVGACHSQICN